MQCIGFLSHEAKVRCTWANVMLLTQAVNLTALRGCPLMRAFREKLRQLELPSTLASKSNPAFSTPSSRPQLAAAVSSQAVTVAGGSALVHAGEVQLQLNQDLVGATVKLDSANRRMEVLEREKDRLNKSLEDAQVGWGLTIILGSADFVLVRLDSKSSMSFYGCQQARPQHAAGSTICCSAAVLHVGSRACCHPVW